jgi:hypothetical protein
MRTRQRGITLIGWIFLLAPLALVAYAGIRMSTVLLNYMKVSQALERTANQLRDDETLSANSIRVALAKQFDIDSIDYPKINDIAIRKDGGSWVLQAEYDDGAPLFANAELVVHFDKVARID